MATDTSWENLPSVIIVEILSYLPVTDKLESSSTCKRWRNCLFNPSLWRQLDFRFKYGNRKGARFLTDVVGRFVKEGSIEFNSKYFADVRDCLRLLQELGKNGNLEKLVLKPISFQVSWPGQEYDRPQQENLQDLYTKAINDIVKNSRHLHHLSLGCIPELTDQSEEVLCLLEQFHHSDIESLHIASVKEDPDSYGILDFPVDQFNSFNRLHTLGIDYDYVTNDLLLQFVNIKGKTPLERLILHVHGMENEHEKISNATWDRVVKANPNLAVTLSLIHSLDGCANISDILRSAMPLVHFRMFFCQGVNISGINFISRCMGTRLESIHIVDGLDRGQDPMVYDIIGDEDPFVMMAWKCPNLKHFTLIGYDMCMEDIIAIARLRGPQLKTFDIPQCCISVVQEAGEEIVNMEDQDTQFLNEVSASLGRKWQPIPDEDLPLAVLDPLADAESAYLSILLNDQCY